MTLSHQISAPAAPKAGFGTKKAAPFKSGGGRKKSSKNNFKGQTRKKGS
jgi:hypothetical protein